MQSKKKLKITTIGILNEQVKVNDLGSPYLHKQHEIVIRAIDNAKVGRAIVLDQHIIDVLFHKDYLDSRQHKVCDKYLSIISKSGSYPQSSSWAEKIFTSRGISPPLSRSCILLGVQKKIKTICGGRKEKIFWKLMTDNPDKITLTEIKTMKDCSNALLDYWYINKTNPVSLFQQALISPYR